MQNEKRNFNIRQSRNSHSMSETRSFSNVLKTHLSAPQSFWEREGPGGGLLERLQTVLPGTRFTRVARTDSVLSMPLGHR